MSSEKGLLAQLSCGIKRYILYAAATTVVYVFFSFLMPQVIKVTVDSVIGDDPISMPAFVVRWIEGIGGAAFLREKLIFCGVGVVFCSFMMGLFNFLSRLCFNTFGQRLIKRLRQRLYAHIQRLPFEWHVKNQTGDIIQRCTSDVETVQNFFTNQMSMLIRAVMLIAGALCMMFAMNVPLSLVALAFMPFISLYSGIFHRLISKKFRDADEAEGDLTVAVQENLTGAAVVRAFGREQFEVEKFSRLNRRFGGKWIGLGYITGAYWGCGSFFVGLQVMAIVVFGSHLAVQGDLTLGEFLAFVSYNQSLAWPIRGLGRIVSELSRMNVSLSRIKEILNYPQEPREPEAARPDMTGWISFEHVTFSYGSGTPVLRDLSFDIKPGETFGILGPTGAGKSTITYLLTRLYDLPDGCGSIKIGGTDIKGIDRTYLRESVGLVLQEPFLFSKTVRDNIAITQPDAPMEKVRACAAVAAIDRSIMEFENGYDTMVGERGVTLSGGQKQRVAIARTLMRQPPVIIFDDSMSAVDLETDKQIRQAIGKMAGKRITIIISHRINTLMQADRIMVLEEGRLTAIGSHSELLQKDGMYKRVYELQSRAAQAAGGEGEQ